LAAKLEAELAEFSAEDPEEEASELVAADGGAAVDFSEALLFV